MPPTPQLDQLVIDSAVEKREMERKHAAIQQRVRVQEPAPSLSPAVPNLGLQA